MPSRSNIEYAKGQIKKADERREGLPEAGSVSHNQTPNVISDCQACIELYTKAMFKIVDVDPPRKHEFSLDDDEVGEFLHADFPDGFQSEDRLPRVIFLTQFWREFYTLSKYGHEKLNITPEDLFEIGEARLALEHTDFAYRTATHMLIAAQEDPDFD